LALLAALALALVQPTQAGTQDAPEIQDPADDQSILGTVPAQDEAGGNSDILAGWVTGETATDVHLFILSQGDWTDGTAGPYTYQFHLTVGGTEYTATATTGAPPTAGGVATALALDGSTVDLTVPKASIGSPAAGDSMTGLFIESAGGNPNQLPFGAFGDRAPDDGAGTDYVFNGGLGGPTTPGDADDDGLNDTCETRYFGSLNATDNASADPDGDGLTNGQECALGTDPTNPDTDGDGADDKDDSAPTDPAEGGNATSSSTSSTTSRSSSTSHPPSSTSASKGSVTDLAGAIDKLQSDVGYLGMSAGGFLAVLVLCIIGLAVRWSL
jgi:hypothetical protein